MCYNNTESLVLPEVNQAIDNLERVMIDNFEPAEAELDHVFCKGMYVRHCLMPSGMRVTSKIHMEEHPYFVMSGIAEVWIDGVGWQTIKAPFHGMTKAGTRRVLRIIENCYWITVHSNPDDGQDLEVIEDRIIEKHDNPLLDGINSQQIENE